jgi:hypothetical protein
LQKVKNNNIKNNNSMATTDKKQKKIILTLNRKKETVEMELYGDDKQSFIDTINRRMRNSGWDENKTEVFEDGTMRILWIYNDNWDSMQEAFDYIQENIDEIND